MMHSCNIVLVTNGDDVRVLLFHIFVRVAKTVKLRHSWTLEEMTNRQDLIQIFKVYKGFTKMDICELSTIKALKRY